MRLSKDRLQASQTTKIVKIARSTILLPVAGGSVSYFGRGSAEAIEIYSRRLGVFDASFQASTIQASNRATGAAMDLLKICDTRNLPSTARRRVNILSGRWAKPI